MAEESEDFSWFAGRRVKRECYVRDSFAPDLVAGICRVGGGSAMQLSSNLASPASADGVSARFNFEEESDQSQRSFRSTSRRCGGAGAASSITPRGGSIQRSINRNNSSGGGGDCGTMREISNNLVSSTVMKDQSLYEDMHFSDLLQQQERREQAPPPQPEGRSHSRSQPHQPRCESATISSAARARQEQAIAYTSSNNNYHSINRLPITNHQHILSSNNHLHQEDPERSSFNDEEPACETTFDFVGHDHTSDEYSHLQSQYQQKSLTHHYHHQQHQPRNLSLFPAAAASIDLMNSSSIYSNGSSNNGNTMPCHKQQAHLQPTQQQQSLSQQDEVLTHLAEEEEEEMVIATTPSHNSRQQSSHLAQKQLYDRSFHSMQAPQPRVQSNILRQCSNDDPRQQAMDKTSSSSSQGKKTYRHQQQQRGGFFIQEDKENGQLLPVQTPLGSAGLRLERFMQSSSRHLPTAVPSPSSRVVMTQNSMIDDDDSVEEGCCQQQLLSSSASSAATTSRIIQAKHKRALQQQQKEDHDIRRRQPLLPSPSEYTELCAVLQQERARNDYLEIQLKHKCEELMQCEVQLVNLQQRYGEHQQHEDKLLLMNDLLMAENARLGDKLLSLDAEKQHIADQSQALLDSVMLLQKEAQNKLLSNASNAPGSSTDTRAETTSFEESTMMLLNGPLKMNGKKPPPQQQPVNSNGWMSGQQLADSSENERSATAALKVTVHQLKGLLNLKTNEMVVSKVSEMLNYSSAVRPFVERIIDMVHRSAPAGFFQGEEQSQNQSEQTTLKQCWGFLKKVMEKYITLKKQVVRQTIAEETLRSIREVIMDGGEGKIGGGQSMIEEEMVNTVMRLASENKKMTAIIHFVKNSLKLEWTNTLQELQAAIEIEVGKTKQQLQQQREDCTAAATDAPSIRQNHLARVNDRQGRGEVRNNERSFGRGPSSNSTTAINQASSSLRSMIIVQASSKPQRGGGQQ